MSMIEARELTKIFIAAKKRPGLRGALRGLFRPERSPITAVDGVSFDIAEGEIVGYLGPNGAGKSTTVKMLTGILRPTTGEVRVNNRSPHHERKAVAFEIGVVFGQRTQLYWDLRLGESFELLRRIYRVEKRDFEQNLAAISDTLGLQRFIDRPVRQLSLGERMRGELAAAVLHAPKVLFLDEPTIGLDVEAKHAVRAFIKEINRSRGTTVILTTHDLDDVEQLCTRLIVINHGKIVEDGPLADLVSRLAPSRRLTVDFETEPPENFSHPRARIARRNGARLCFEFDREGITASSLIADLSQMHPVRDLSLSEPDIEDVIRRIYNQPEP